MRKRMLWIVGLIAILIFNFLFLISSQAAAIKKADLCQNAAGCPDTDTRLCATIKGSAFGFYEVTIYCYEPVIRN